MSFFVLTHPHRLLLIYKDNSEHILSEVTKHKRNVLMQNQNLTLTPPMAVNPGMSYPRFI